MKTAIYYFTGAGLGSHTHAGTLFVEFLAGAARAGVHLSGVTTISRDDVRRPVALARRFAAARHRAHGPVYAVPTRFSRAFWTWRARLHRRRGEDILIHARKAGYAAEALELKRWIDVKVRVIADLEGAVAEEADYISEQAGTGALAAHEAVAQARRLESAVVAESDLVICVSERLKAYLRSQYGLRDGLVIPSVVSEDLFHVDAVRRRAVRSALGIAPDVRVLVFAGGLYPWQLFDRVVAAATIGLRMGIPLHLLVLTPHRAEADAAIARAQLPASQVTIRSVRHDEVPDYLNASDAGLLLRGDALMNHLASPGKFPEYLACGLPVLTTRHIGDAALHARDQPFVWLLNDPFSDTELAGGLRGLLDRPLSLADREAISTWAIAQYGRDRWMPVLARAYADLTGATGGQVAAAV